MIRYLNGEKIIVKYKMRTLTPTDKLIVEEVIKKSARKEAMEILEKCSEKRFNEFKNNYYINKLNICCMSLDFAKDELVEQNIMTQNENDFFGFNS